MANRIEFRIDGLRELKGKIAELDQAIQVKIARAAVTAGARVAVLKARAIAPVLTAHSAKKNPRRIKGALKKSIRSLVDKQRSKRGIYTRAIGVFQTKGTYGATPQNRRKGRVGKTYLKDGPTFYWKFQEFGTVKQPARPFLSTSFKNSRDQMIQAMKDKILSELAKYK